MSEGGFDGGEPPISDVDKKGGFAVNDVLDAGLGVAGEVGDEVGKAVREVYGLKPEEKKPNIVNVIVPPTDSPIDKASHNVVNASSEVKIEPAVVNQSSIASTASSPTTTDLTK